MTAVSERRGGSQETAMARKVHEYRGAGITVRYDVKRCIHAKECVRGLRRVFDPERRPWVEPDQASSDEVAQVVMRCPTGALYFERTDGGAQESIPEENEIRVEPDGPLYLSGEIEITSADGTALARETRLALCRCGASRNKPFCDNSHVEISFEDSGAVAENRLAEAPAGESDKRLRIAIVANGPLLLRGPMEVRGSDGASHQGGKGALCRCGASANKPYCDGSHAVIGFEADG